MMTNNFLLDTPAHQDTHQVIPQANFWQVVADILDNPFIKAGERDKVLFEQGYRAVTVGNRWAD